MDTKIKTFITWADKFPALSREPMDNSTSRILISLGLSTPEKIKAMADDLFKNLFLYQVLVKRAEYIGLTADPAVLIFAAASLDSPAKAVMIAYLLREYQVRKGVPSVTLDHLCFDLIPMGWPTDTAWTELWDAQKLTGDDFKTAKTDNFLDTIGNIWA